MQTLAFEKGRYVEHRKGRPTMRAIGCVARATVLLAVSLSYLAYVFRFFEKTFWTHGIGDWVDPYFINYLLEHWYRSALTFSDPTSPPMYFPVRGTLGYSHGLILYAPFYLLVRPLVHPFQAYTLTLILVMETGIICLYLILRWFLRLSFVESLLLTVFFFSSQNVINGGTGVWSQTASVFLIPPILLSVLASARMRRGFSSRLSAAIGGLLFTLLFTQEFYTGMFTLLLAALVTAGPVLVIAAPRATAIVRSITRERHVSGMVALLAFVLASGWMCYVWASGGMEAHVFGLTIRSHDWRRPALLAMMALAFILIASPQAVRPHVTKVTPWFRALIVGALAGTAVFFWIYLPAYREHHVFPDDQLLSALRLRDPSRWNSPIDVVNDLSAYDTTRSFKLVFLVCVLAWMPWFRVDRKTRLLLLWFLCVSLVVLLVPVRFNEFSLWKAVFQDLPGLGVIRDPRRIVYVYELIVVLATGLVLSTLSSRSLLRIATVVALVVLLATDWNRVAFDFLRPVATFDEWVAAPVAADASCRSFFIKGASARYMSRSFHMWSLYSIDSMFIASSRSIPTLNGYSAWSPDGWELGNPQESVYRERVERWIDRHQLSSVCELDIDNRTMTPHIPTIPKGSSAAVVGLR